MRGGDRGGRPDPRAGRPGRAALRPHRADGAQARGGWSSTSGPGSWGLAGPAEVLVTGVLRDLIPGGGFRFEDRGRQSLKGISEGSSILSVGGGRQTTPP